MKEAAQEQLIAMRRNQILDAAATVFAQKGFHSTTIKDIARAAGLADGTIYLYFANKPALLLGIFERMKAAVIAEAVPPAIGELDIRTFLQILFQHSLMALKGDNFALFRIIVSEVMVNDDLRAQYYEQILEPTLSLAETYFQAHAANQGLRPDQAKLTIRAISGMVLGLMLHHVIGDSVVATHWDELPDFLTELLVQGLKGNSQ